MPRPGERLRSPKESASGERRVALVPEVVERLAKSDVEVTLEAGAGESAQPPRLGL